MRVLLANPWFDPAGILRPSGEVVLTDDLFEFLPPTATVLEGPEPEEEPAKPTKPSKL